MTIRVNKAFYGIANLIKTLNKPPIKFLVLHISYLYSTDIIMPSEPILAIALEAPLAYVQLNQQWLHDAGHKNLALFFRDALPEKVGNS